MQAVPELLQHDGMSGTERQDVTNDYEQRISESHFEAEAGVAASLKKLLKLPATDSLLHCNCNLQGSCLNLTICAATNGEAPAIPPISVKSFTK